MKKRSMFTLAAAALVVAALAFGGCSENDEGDQSNSMVGDVVDSVAAAINDSFTRARLASAEVKEPAAAVRADVDFSDMIVVDSTVYAVVDDNLIIFDLEQRSSFTVPSGEPICAVTYHGGKVYVGGETLFEVIDSTLEPVAMDLPGTITALYSHGYRLMIGTTNGLLATSIFGNEILFDDIAVTAMVEDRNGLWVGTDGAGLYRWDGLMFSQRYLYRDTTIFDHVKALDFGHEHLYVGTSDGLYIYDGGRWTTLTAEDGLPSSDIRAIDASGWVVYLATADGLTSWFNGDVMPVKKIGDVIASTVQVYGTKILVGSADRGLLMKTGPVVTTLLEAFEDDQPAPVVVSMQ